MLLASLFLKSSATEVEAIDIRESFAIEVQFTIFRKSFATEVEATGIRSSFGCY